MLISLLKQIKFKTSVLVIEKKRFYRIYVTAGKFFKMLVFIKRALAVINPNPNVKKTTSVYKFNQETSN